MGAIMGQTIGGIIFSLLAGQPLIIIMTTAPIALYIKIIVAVAEEHDLDFYALYTRWEPFFLEKDSVRP